MKHQSYWLHVCFHYMEKNRVNILQNFLVWSMQKKKKRETMTFWLNGECSFFMTYPLLQTLKHLISVSTYIKKMSCYFTKHNVVMLSVQIWTVKSLVKNPFLIILMRSSLFSTCPQTHRMWKRPSLQVMHQVFSFMFFSFMSEQFQLGYIQVCIHYSQQHILPISLQY